MNDLEIFKNEEFGEIRIVKIDNEPWFVGKDVASVLGYSNNRKALSDHVDDEDKNDGVTIRDTIGRNQRPVLINESGLYSLVLSSKLPTAKKFKHWITSEVIPTIRQTGTYSMAKYQPKATSVGEVANLLKILERTMKAEKQSPEVIAKNIEQVCKQFGIELSEDFTKKNDNGQMAFVIVGVK